LFHYAAVLTQSFHCGWDFQFQERVKQLITALHLLPRSNTEVADPAYKGVDRVLRNLPEVKHIQITTDDPANAILSEVQKYDLLVLGATAQPPHSLISIGPVADNILRQSAKGVLVVKSRKTIAGNMDSEIVGQTQFPFWLTSGLLKILITPASLPTFEHLVEIKGNQNLHQRGSSGFE